MINHLGEMLPKAGPSTPVRLGLDNPPAPGDVLNVVKSEREAKKVVQNRINERKEGSTDSGLTVSLEDFFSMGAADSNEKRAQPHHKVYVQGLMKLSRNLFFLYQIKR